MPRRVLLGLAAIVAVLLACAQSGFAASAGLGRADRDQVRALRLTVDWLATYPRDLWVGAELPRPCRTLPSGRRACPIAIRLRAWTQGELAPWRCDAHALLPSATRGPVRRTSARCEPLAEPEAYLDWSAWPQRTRAAR